MTQFNSKLNSQMELVQHPLTSRVMLTTLKNLHLDFCHFLRQ